MGQPTAVQIYSDHLAGAKFFDSKSYRALPSTCIAKHLLGQKPNRSYFSLFSQIACRSTAGLVAVAGSQSIMIFDPSKGLTMTISHPSPEAKTPPIPSYIEYSIGSSDLRVLDDNSRRGTSYPKAIAWSPSGLGQNVSPAFVRGKRMFFKCEFMSVPVSRSPTGVGMLVRKPTTKRLMGQLNKRQSHGHLVVSTTYMFTL